MLDAPIVAEATKAKKPDSVQGRYSGETSFDFPGSPVTNPFGLLTLQIAGLQPDGIPNWSYYPHFRDSYLRLLSKREPIMAGAKYSVVSRFSSLRWNIKGGRNSKLYYQRIFAEADGGAGWGQFASKVVEDLLTQDNGAFIELSGAGREDKPLKGRVTGVYHLDSAQCWRTFDPEYPVIYTNPLDNSYHRLHKTRVIMLSSNPQPDERGRNVGYCAVSRALKMMQIVRHIQTYKDEKISGTFKRALIYGGPLNPKQFDQIVEKSELQSENSLLTVLNNIPVILSTLGDLKLDMLDLASLPDGFDYEKEINIYVYILALCFGVDAREFWPATASGATKADASIQHLKAQGKGIADIINSMQTAFNWQIMPSNGDAEFEFDFTDDEQDKQQAEIHTIKATNIRSYQDAGWITPQEGRSLAIAQGLIDPAQLTSTEDAVVADDTAPMATEDLATQPTAEGQVDEFDTTGGVKVRPVENAGPSSGRFRESQHPRSNDGKFGSGGGTSKPAAPVATTATAPTEDPNASPLSKALQKFLSDNKLTGKFSGSTLKVPGDTKDRSAEIQAALQANGFPNAKVTARKTKKGYSYRISGVKPKKPKKGKKAATMSDVDDYKTTLEGLMTGLIDRVVESPNDFDDAIDDLFDDFVDDLPQRLTDGFGVGLAGTDASDEGVDRLKTVGQTSVDYFKKSLMVDLAATSIVGLEAEEIRKALNPFVSRLGMYAGAFWESVWQGQRDATPKTRKVKRILNDGADHCKTCPGKAKTYDSYDDMVSSSGVPGDGSDTCLSNCRCTIEVEDEDGGFSPLVGSPTVFVEPLFEVIR